MRQGIGLSLFVTFSFLFFAQPLFAQEQMVVEETDTEINRSPAASGVSTKGEYSFRWLDPDKKIYVLQNRRYRKANHFIVSAMFGRGLTGTYKSSFNVDPRMTYYFSEIWGVELFYSKFFNSDSNTLTNLQAAAPTALPNIREITSQFGINMHWSPWYSKINVFNTVLYFDWFFSLGVGKIDLQIDTRTAAADPSVFVISNPLAVYLGTGQIFHVSRSFLARIDFLGTIYKAEAVSKGEESAWVSYFSFNLGVGLKL